MGRRCTMRTRPGRIAVAVGSAFATPHAPHPRRPPKATAAKKSYKFQNDSMRFPGRMTWRVLFRKENPFKWKQCAGRSAAHLTTFHLPHDGWSPLFGTRWLALETTCRHPPCIHTWLALHFIEGGLFRYARELGPPSPSPRRLRPSSSSTRCLARLKSNLYSAAPPLARLASAAHAAHGSITVSCLLPSFHPPLPAAKSTRHKPTAHASAGRFNDTLQVTGRAPRASSR